MPNISDEEYRLLRGAYGLMDQIASDPRTKTQFQKMVKAKHPGIQTTEDEVKPYVEPFEQFMKEARERWEREDNGRVESKLNDDFARLRKDHGYTEDGIEKIKKIMIDRNIPDPDAAAALWERQNPQSDLKPSGMKPSRWMESPTDNDQTYFEALMKDEDGAAENMAINVWNEMRDKR